MTEINPTQKAKKKILKKISVCRCLQALWYHNKFWKRINTIGVSGDYILRNLLALLL